MRCPYLSSATKKECAKMLEAQVSGDLNEFDIKHFCEGNPIYCYYFRLPQPQKTTLNLDPPKPIINIPMLPSDPEKNPLVIIREPLFRQDTNL